MGKLDYTISLLKRELLWDECYLNKEKTDGIKDSRWEEVIESLKEAIKILEKHNE